MNLLILVNFVLLMKLTICAPLDKTKEEEHVEQDLEDLVSWSGAYLKKQTCSSMWIKMRVDLIFLFSPTLCRA